MNMCLCKTHENMRLMLKAVSRLGFNGSPDEFIGERTIEEAGESLQQLPADSDVTYWEWSTVLVAFGNVTKNRVKRIERKASKTDFIDKFVSLMTTFKSHASRVIAQYRAVHALKDSLPPGHVTVQMDFSENWTVSSSDEIQSAYFGKAQITIHPAVVHYLLDNVLVHKSYVLVTDERSHCAPTVVQFMKQLIPRMRDDLPVDVTFVHYITDSPSSQYRNLQMFSVLFKLDVLFGTDASWLYYEAVHGKGPCDGVGGASKRMADDYVRRGHTILTAAEYVSLGNSAGKVEYIEVTQSAIEECRVAVEKLKTTVAVHSTMKYHAAVRVRPGVLAMRTTSCNSPCCFHDGRYVLGCGHWVEHALFAGTDEAVVDEQEPAPAVAPAERAVRAEHAQPPNFRIGSYVVADFDGTYFVGEVLQSPNEGSVKVKYLRATGGQMNRYNWPEVDDIDDTPIDHIFLPWIPAPYVTGGRHRTQYVLREGVRESIGVAHHKFLKC